MFKQFGHAPIMGRRPSKITAYLRPIYATENGRVLSGLALLQKA
jgi:hypothetical protein